ncbi:MAG: radical SAM protein [Promethearchaeota archaeon]
MTPTNLYKKINVSERKTTEIRYRDKYLTHIGMMLTERCNISCRHCLIDCCTSFGSEWQAYSLYKTFIQIIHNGITKTVGFTGGEPFLEFKKLKKLVNLCELSGINTSVVTNGFWASTLRKTHRYLLELQGLTKIAVSTDKFHQEFIPIQNVKNIIEEANQLNIECQLRVSHLNDPIGETGKIKKDLPKFEGKYELTSQPVQFFGRAVIHLKRSQLYSYDAMNLACRTADRVVITPSGEILACCGPQDGITEGHPLWVGRVDKNSIEDIFKTADANPIIHILRLWGPGALVRIIEDQAEKKSVKISPPSDSEKHDICLLCRYALDSEEKLELLKSAIEEQDLILAVAVARATNFAETSMFLNDN